MRLAICWLLSLASVSAVGASARAPSPHRSCSTPHAGPDNRTFTVLPAGCGQSGAPAIRRLRRGALQLRQGQSTSQPGVCDGHEFSPRGDRDDPARSERGRAPAGGGHELHPAGHTVDPRRSRPRRRGPQHPPRVHRASAARAHQVGSGTAETTRRRRHVPMCTGNERRTGQSGRSRKSIVTSGYARQHARRGWTAPGRLLSLPTIDRSPMADNVHVTTPAIRHGPSRPSGRLRHDCAHRGYEAVCLIVGSRQLDAASAVCSLGQPAHEFLASLDDMLADG